MIPNTSTEPLNQSEIMVIGGQSLISSTAEDAETVIIDTVSNGNATSLKY